MDIPVSLTDAVNGLPDAAFLVGNDGIIVAANAVAAKMFGYTHTQMIGSQVDDLMPESARGYHRQVRLGAVEEPRPRSFTSGATFECERRNGELFQADINLSPTVVDGVPLTWAIVRDIDSPDRANTGRRQAMVALDAIGRMAATTFDLKHDFAAVAERLYEVVPHDRIAVMLIDEDDPSQAEVLAVAGEIHPDFPVGSKVAVKDSAIAWVTKSRAPVSFTSDRAEYAPPVVQLGLEGDFTETFGVPLFDRENIVGMIMAATKNPRRYSELQKSLLVRLGGHLAIAVVNQRMRVRVEEQAKEIELISAIGKMANSSPDLSVAFASAETSILQFVHFDRLAVGEIDRETNSIVGRFELGDKLPGFYEQRQLLVAGELARFDDMISTGEPIEVDEEQIARAAEEHPLMAALHGQGYQRLLYVPLIVGDKNVGLMTFGSKNEIAYTDAEIAIASRIGDQVAGSVSNSFLFDRTKSDSAVESVLAEIGRVVGSSLDLQSIEARLGPLLRRLVDSNSVLITGIAENGKFLRVLYADYEGVEPEEGLTPDETLTTLYPIDGTTAETSLRTRESVIVNARSGADFKEKYPGAGSSHISSDLKSVMSVPLVANDQVFGFLNFRSSKPEMYDQGDLELAEKIALQLASSVAFTELRLRDLLLADERAVLTLVGNTMGSAVDLADVWDEFVKQISTIMRFDHIGLAAVDHSDQTINILHDSLWPELASVKYNKGEIFQLEGTVTSEVVKRRDGFFHSSLGPEEWKQFYPNSSPTVGDIPIRSLIGVPLIWGDEVVAGLFVHSVEDDAYDDEVLRLMERVAAQIAGSVAGSLLRIRETELATEHRILSEIGTVMGAATDLNGAWPNFTDLVEQLLDFDRLLLVSVDSDARTATVFCDRVKTAQDPELPVSGDVFDMEGTITEHVVRTRDSFSFGSKDEVELEEQFPGSFGFTNEIPWKSNMAIPLIWGGDVVAVLFIHGHSENGYSGTELGLGERVVAQIAGPVAGSLLRDAESEIATQRSVLVRVNSLLGSVEDIGDVWSEFGTIVSEILEFDRCVVLNLDEDAGLANVLYDDIKTVFTTREFGLVSAHESYDLDGSFAGLIVTGKQSIVLNQEEPNQLLEKFEGLRQQGINLPFLSNMGVPLIWGDKVVACIFFGSRTVDFYGDSELAIAERIAAQIAGPIAGAVVRQRDSELVTERQLREAAEMETAVLSELNETKSNFIGAMSHELKTPLTSIVAFSDILSRSNEKGLDGRPLQQIKVIQRNARHLEGMINELLDLSRMESGRFEILKSPFDFAAIVSEAIESSQPQLEAMTQTVDFQISADVLLVNGDRERLFQVVTNLLSNASKYSPNDSKIEIEVKEDQRWLTVEVRDQGPGVPDDDPEALFAMFGRADNEITRRVPGTGIGLHVSKRIIDEHGGQITIKSRDDGGAIARFRIPLGVNAIS